MINNKIKFLQGLADLMEECGVDEIRPYTCKNRYQDFIDVFWGDMSPDMEIESGMIQPEDLRKLAEES